MSINHPPPSPSFEIPLFPRLILLTTCTALLVAFLTPDIRHHFLQILSLRPSLPPPDLPTPNSNTSAPSSTLFAIKPSLNWSRDPNHPRTRLLTSLLTLLQYHTTLSDHLYRKAAHFRSLSPQHRRILAPIEYSDKISTALELLSRNDRDVVKPLLSFAMGYYGITWAELEGFRRSWGRRGEIGINDVEQVFKLFVRDWGNEGEVEREATFGRILEVSGVRGRVLVPGAGAGRLVMEIAGMERVDEVVANEWSYLVAAAGKWVWSLDAKKRIKFYPHISWWSHRRTNEGGLFKGSEFPDVTPVVSEGKKVEWMEGDFVTVFNGQEGTFDAVVTLFFIDTARNLVEYLERIWALLKPGGTWVNVGPLLYGTQPLVELSLEEVLEVVEGMGFELQVLDEKWGEDTFKYLERGERWGGKVKSVLAGYAWDTEATMQRNVYEAQYWVARKPEA